MKTSTKVIGIAFAAVVLLSALGAALLKRPAVSDDRREVVINDQIITAIVAATPAEQARGLGGRSALGANEGLLFEFSGPGVYPFWMKDMQFPIDIIWIRDGRIVDITERLDPQIGAPDSELRMYSPQEAVDEVLEIASGRAALLHARIGDTVTVRTPGK
jgi:hypothetical protein